MKRMTKAVLGCVLIASLIIAGVAHAEYLGNGKKKASAAGISSGYFVDKDGKIQKPQKDRSKELGTAENPFFVLEIVPWDQWAQFGYQIGGWEPIDLRLVALDDGSSGVTLSGDALSKAPNGYVGYWKDELPAGWTPKNGQVKTEQIDCLGVMKATPGAGDYSYSGGVFAKTTNGGYTFEACSVMEIHAMTDAEKSAYVAPSGGLSFPCKVNLEKREAYVNQDSYNIYVNNNNFLKYAVGLAYEMEDGKRKLRSAEEIEKAIAAYHTVVYTVTPEDLNMNADLVDLADLITLHKEDTGIFQNKSKSEYLRADLFLHDETTTLGKRIENKEGATFVSNPIDWDVAVRIYEKYAGLNGYAPVLFETDVVSTCRDSGKASESFQQVFADGVVETGTLADAADNNLWKVFLMMNQMESATFFQLFRNADGTLFRDKDGNLLNSGNFGYIESAVTKKDGTKLKIGTFRLNQAGSGVSHWDYPLFYPYHVTQSAQWSEDNVRAICESYGILHKKDGTFLAESGDAQQRTRNFLYRHNGDTFASAKFHRDTPAEKESVNAVADNVFNKKIYDFLQATDPDNKRPDAVDTADVLWSMLNSASNQPLDPNEPVNTNLKVLVLEPSGTKDTFVSKESLRVLLGAHANFTGNIEIDQMTTSEFIGKKTELLSEYDMIYIGMDQAANVYGLPAGFTYAHSGKLIDFPNDPTQGNDKRTLFLLEPGNYWNYEFQKKIIASGNDISKLALEKLQEFRAAGFPILYGTGFFTAKDMSSAAVSGAVDHNSYLYELASDHISDALYEGSFDGFDEAAWNNERIKLRDAIQNIAAKKVRLEYSEDDMPAAYMGMNTPNYINPDPAEVPKLQFKFKVIAPAGSTYSLRLYIDGNNDGNFADAENTEAKLSVKNLTDNTPGSHTNIEAGKEYTVTEVVDGLVGSLYWKLDLVRDGKVYASVSRLSAIKEYADGTDLKVLQIIPSVGTTVDEDGKTVYGGVNSEDGKGVYLPVYDDIVQWKNNDSLNLIPADSQDTTRLFLEKMYDKSTGKSKINGLNMVFERKQQSDIESAVSAKNGGKAAAELTKDEYFAYFKGSYDMIVCGFADSYAGVKNEAILDALNMYREEGYAVLFTHDTTNLNGYVGDDETVERKLDSSQGWWFDGRVVTEKFRSWLGMDRYSLMTSAPNQGGLSRADYPWETSATSSARNVIYHSNATQFLMAVHGISNATLLAYDEGLSNIETNKIKVINEGAITSYPYDIPDEIEVSSTHPQWFQLDLEDEHINVWYTLEPALDGKYDAGETLNRWNRDTAKLQKISNYYGGMSGDVRNNYYIYNVNNVTYSGVGHSGSLTEKEVELFVNTFVAAYRATAKPVSIVVTNEDAVVKKGSNSTPDSYFLPADVNADTPDEAFGLHIVDGYTLRKAPVEQEADESYTDFVEVPNVKAKRVFFWIKDNSIYNNGQYSIQTILTGITKANEGGKRVELAIRKASDDSLITSSSQMKNGSSNVYYVDIPLNVETNGGKSAIDDTAVELLIAPFYLINGTSTPTEKEESDILIVPRGLFNLD